MGKASRKKRRNTDPAKTVAVQKVSAPEQGRSWFLPTMAVVLVIGAAGIALMASQRESSVGIVPDFGDQGDVRPIIADHWHSAYGVYQCDAFTAPIQNDAGPDGIHTHGDGFIHVHPSSANATGMNANIGRFMANAGARLTADSLRIDELGIDLDDSIDCDGEPAVLQMAYWSSQLSDEDPEIITGTDIAEFHFDGDGSAFTIAFAPEGADIPKPPTAASLYGGG